jgi:hypothetical protein
MGDPTGIKTAEATRNPDVEKRGKVRQTAGKVWGGMKTGGAWVADKAPLTKHSRAKAAGMKAGSARRAELEAEAQFKRIWLKSEEDLQISF